MSSGSEDDPYGGDDSDVDRDFNPNELSAQLSGSSSENSDVIEHNLEKSRGKKRLRKEKEWKRNIQKERRLAGKEYVSTSKVVVPQRVMGNTCNCRLKCFDKVPLVVRQNLFDAFNKLPSKDLQDSYLCRNIALKNVARKRQRTDTEYKPKSITCEFSVSVSFDHVQHPLIFLLF